MSRYFTMPERAEWWESNPAGPLPHPQVYPSDPVKTGLLTADGKDIYKGPDPIGFLPQR